MMKKIIIYVLSIILILASQEILAAKEENKALSLRYVSKLNKSVTFLGLDALEIGRDWGIGDEHERQHVNAATARAVLKRAAKYKISIIATGSAGHQSEELIGLYGSPYRNQFLISTQVGETSLLAVDKRCKVPSSDRKYCNSPTSIYDFSPDAIRQNVENSLKKLKTNHLDIVFIHFGPNAKQVIDKGEVVAVLKELKKAGKIHYIGASINGELATRCINSNDFDAIELEYNLLNQSNKTNIELAHKKGMAVIVRGGLGTGLLTSQVAPYLGDSHLPYRKQVQALLKLTHGDYNKLTALALAFLYQNENISSVIVGAGKPEYLIRDVKILQNFRDKKLLKQAENLMMQYHPDPNSYTSDVDVYFRKQNLGDSYEPPLNS